MQANYRPGDFILKTASTGISVVAALTRFGCGESTKRFATAISVPTTLFSEIGKEVNENAIYFKDDNFEKCFTVITDRWSEHYEKVLSALQKATSDDDGSLEVGPSSDYDVKLPRKRWKRLLWALNMTEEEATDLERLLDDSFNEIYALQRVVSLLVIQCHAKERSLLPYELHTLRQLKLKLGDILEALRDAGVGSIMAFGLSDRGKAVNAMQLAGYASLNTASESFSDTDSTITSSTDAKIPYKEIRVNRGNYDLSVPPPPGFREHNKAIAKSSEMEGSSSWIPDTFEMYQFSVEESPLNIRQASFGMFGIFFKHSRRDVTLISYMAKIHASEDEIKAFIERMREDNARNGVGPLDYIISMSPRQVQDINSWIEEKNKPRLSKGFAWSLDYIAIQTQLNESKRLLWNKKAKASSSYICVLKGESKLPRGLPTPPHHSTSPPIPGLILLDHSVSGKPDSTTKSKERKGLTTIELTGEETETILNDFLASFSTLYDDVNVEDRGATLRAIAPFGDLDYETDDSSSTSSNSLIDD